MIQSLFKNISRFSIYLSLVFSCAFFGGWACSGSSGGGSVPLVVPNNFGPGGGGPAGGAPGGHTGPGGGAAGPVEPPCDTVSTPWGVFCKNWVRSAKMRYGKEGKDSLESGQSTTFYMTEGAPLNLSFQLGVSYREDKPPITVPNNNMVRVVVRSGDKLKYKDLLLSQSKEGDRALGKLEIPVGLGDELSFFYFENGSPKWMYESLADGSKEAEEGDTLILVAKALKPAGLDKLEIETVVDRGSPYPDDFFQGDSTALFKEMTTKEFEIFKINPERPLNRAFLIGIIRIGQKSSPSSSIFDPFIDTTK